MNNGRKNRKFAGFIKFHDETVTERFELSGYGSKKEYQTLVDAFQRITSPKIAQLIIDTGCNQKCVHCCLGQAHNKTPTSNLQIKKIGNSLLRQGLKIDPYPTEPLMNELALEAYSWFREPKKRPFLTNGTAPLAQLPGSQLAERLNNLGFSEIWLSLHGSNAESHDSFTGTPGSFSILMETIQKIAKLANSNEKLNLVFDICVHKENISELPDIFAIAAENHAHRAYVMRLIPPCDNQIPDRMIMDHQASCDALVELNRLRLAYKGRIWIQMGQSWGVNFHALGIFYYLGATKIPFCFAMAPRITVHSGRKTIYPCFITASCSQFEIGSLEGDENKIHFNRLGENLLKWHEEWHFKARGSCALGDCPYSEICHGGCRGTAVMPSVIAGNKPDWFAPFPNCMTRLLEEMS